MAWENTLTLTLQLGTPRQKMEDLVNNGVVQHPAKANKKTSQHRFHQRNPLI